MFLYFYSNFGPEFLCRSLGYSNVYKVDEINNNKVSLHSRQLRNEPNGTRADPDVVDGNHKRPCFQTKSPSKVGVWQSYKKSRYNSVTYQLSEVLQNRKF